MNILQKMITVVFTCIFYYYLLISLFFFFSGHTEMPLQGDTYRHINTHNAILLICFIIYQNIYNYNEHIKMTLLQLHLH